MALGLVLSSCFKDDADKTADEYAEWRETNTDWFEAQKILVENGKYYYKTVTAPWDPSAQVLIHWFNDTTKTQGNLKPKFSLFRCRLSSGVIEGWAIAVPHMHIGDSCRVLIPYSVGYGTTASGDIKPFSTLKFDIKLVGIPAYEK